MHHAQLQAWRPWFGLVGVAVVSTAVGGCIGGGGGGEKKDAVTATSNLSQPSGSGGGGSAPRTAVPANQGNAFMVFVPDVAKGTPGSISPNTGSKVTFGTPGAWSEVTNPQSNSAVPDNVRRELDRNPGWKVYKRSVSVSLAGGTGGVPDSVASGQQYVVMSCSPGTQGCGSPNVDLDSFVATQNGVEVSEKTVRASTTDRVLLRGKQVYQDTHVARFNPFEPQGKGPWDTINQAAGVQGGGGLQHSYVGEYSDQDLSFLITRIDPNDGPVISDIKGSVTAGAFFGGTATSASQMTSLKNGNVTATYQGYFRGVNGPAGPMTNIDNGTGDMVEIAGQSQINANFGTGAVGGNIFNMHYEDRAISRQNDNSNCNQTRTCQNAYVATDYGVRLDGTMNGSTYSGTAKYTGKASAPGAAASAGSPTGQMLGGFFGPNAAETAGAVRIHGTAPGKGPGTGANSVLTGAFGAKKTGP